MFWRGRRCEVIYHSIICRDHFIICLGPFAKLRGMQQCGEKYSWLVVVVVGRCANKVKTANDLSSCVYISQRPQHY
ncbi:hypothetical protein B0H67DRAFT_94175 [Lasiosphaeris hirsuta]|uniref:Uncharacterized protein n=1 Tax=Lasiosphaeris hirsuta TaxID=260670 RepID=A0AA40BDY1_9PEZI|nr:hypothetical protein B0H67DRAFT_94175 [Lasiosphaeris hirsuta]